MAVVQESEMAFHRCWDREGKGLWLTKLPAVLESSGCKKKKKKNAGKFQISMPVLGIKEWNHHTAKFWRPIQDTVRCTTNYGVRQKQTQEQTTTTTTALQQQQQKTENGICWQIQDLHVRKKEAHAKLRIRANYKYCRIWVYNKKKTGNWQKFQKFHKYPLSIPRSRNWAYFRSTGSGGAWEQPPRGVPWVSGLVGHFVQTWLDSKCSHTVQFLDCSDLNWRCNHYHLFWHCMTISVLMCR